MATTKVLFLAANPEKMDPLSLDVEIRAITKNIRASKYRDMLDLESVWAVRPDDLLQALNEHQPRIVQFSGHGSKAGEIILLDQQQLPKPVNTAALRRLFNRFKENIQVVILNACYSEIQARSIAEVIDCVIGMSDAISDDAAILFTASFYRALGFGSSVQDAYEEGLIAIHLEDIPEEHMPVLITKAGVDAGSVLLVSPPKRRKKPPVNP